MAQTTVTEQQTITVATELGDIAKYLNATTLQLQQMTFIYNSIQGFPEAEVKALSNIIDQIVICSNNIASIVTTAGISTEITALAGIQAEIEALFASLATIQAVFDNLTAINGVNAISADVTTVAGISGDVTTLAGISGAISALGAEVDALVAINTNLTDLLAVPALAEAQADIATAQAVIATAEADRAQTIADMVEIVVGVVDSLPTSLNTPPAWYDYPASLAPYPTGLKYITNYNPSFEVVVNTELAGSASNTMQMPLRGTDMVIDWGDGTVETVTQTATPASANWVTHVYAVAGVYPVQCTKVDLVHFNNTGDRLKVIELKSLGGYPYNNNISAFRGCTNLIATGKLPANVLSVNGFTSMFNSATKVNADISSWNTQNAINMSFMFRQATIFNQPIGNWDVSSVADMSNMFNTATAFNQSLENWQLRLAGVNMASMLNSCGMDVVNYSRTLIGWANWVHLNSGTPSGITLGATGRTYNNTVYAGIGSGHFTDAVSARAYLTTTATFTITGDSDVS